MKKLSKERNGLKVKQVQEYSIHAAGQDPLNLYVLVWIILRQRQEMKNPIIPSLIDFTLKKYLDRHYRNDENDKRG